MPNFGGNNGDDWCLATQKWLGEQGLTMLFFESLVSSDAGLGVYWIASGKSPRGDFYHSVIYRYGKCVHDPHPDGGGLDGKPEEYVLIVPMDMAEWARKQRKSAAA